MRRRRFGIALAASLCVVTAATGPGVAQTATSVSITGTVAGVASQGCADGPHVITTAPQFVLTRTGDTTAALDVSIGWSGGIPTENVVSPTVAHFAAGSATVTITPTFAAVPTPVETLILTVNAGVGYQVGSPATASAQWVFADPSCPRPPPAAPPPVIASPSFTG